MFKTTLLGKLLNEAISLHRAGRLADAEAACRQILKTDPSDFNARHLLGITHYQRGNYEEAIHEIDLALRANPKEASAHSNRGNALQVLKRLDEALTSYDRAIALNPDYFDAFYNRGIALQGLKRLEEALASYDRAIALKPDHADAFNNRGNTLRELKRFDEALTSYDRALALKANYPEAFNNRGATLAEMNRLEEALASYDRAIALKPDYAHAFNNRGTSLAEMNRLEEALASYDRAIALKSDYAHPLNNRGNVLQELKRLDEALTSYERAIALKPDDADAIAARAQCGLRLGRYIEGWADYEWRWQSTRFPSKRPDCASFAIWQGEDLKGRHLLVYAEQGLGDTLQFARYLPLLIQKQCRVTFLTPAKLIRLLRSLPSEIEIVCTLSPERRFDFQCALMSLPHRLGTDLSSIPQSARYLRAEDGLVNRWKKQIGEDGFKIGIVWQGNPHAKADQGRSVPLAQYFALARLPGVRLISLQKGHGLEQLAELPKDVSIETLGDDFDNGSDAFVDTAAVMSSLDLIVTADTAVAHLAGALGRPTWVALKYVPHWTWLLEREDSPWYPTVRLFRQSEPNEWPPVFANIANELRSLVV